MAGVPVEIWRRVMELLIEEADDPFERQRSLLQMQLVNRSCRTASLDVNQELSIAGFNSAIAVAKMLKRRKKAWAKTIRSLTIFTKEYGLKGDERRERFAELKAMAAVLGLCPALETFELHINGIPAHMPSTIFAGTIDALEIFGNQMSLVPHISTLTVELIDATDAGPDTTASNGFNPRKWNLATDLGLYALLAEMRSLEHLHILSNVLERTNTYWAPNLLDKPLFKLKTVEVKECASRLWVWLIGGTDRFHDVHNRSAWPQYALDLTPLLRCRRLCVSLLAFKGNMHPWQFDVDVFIIEAFELDGPMVAGRVAQSVQSIRELQIHAIRRSVEYWDVDNTLKGLLPAIYHRAVADFIQRLPPTLERVVINAVRLSDEGRQLLQQVCNARKVDVVLKV